MLRCPVVILFRYRRRQGQTIPMLHRTEIECDIDETGQEREGELTVCAQIKCVRLLKIPSNLAHQCCHTPIQTIRH